MPNRMLRDWTDSDKIEKVSVHAERFFIRLIMKADDHGCFYADTRLLKSNLFPLLLDQIREADLTRWLAECQEAGLIVLYEVANKKYLQILEFNQRLRQKVQRFPMSADGQHDAVNSPPEEKRSRREVEEEGNVHPLQNSNLFRKPTIPTIEQVEEVFLRQGGTKEMAAKFFAKHGAVDWFLSGSPITNFSNLVPGFITNWNKNNQVAPGQQSKEQNEYEKLMAKQRGKVNASK